MKRELALLLKAQSQILDTPGKTRSNRVQASGNNGSTSRKRVKRTTLDDPMAVDILIVENGDSKSEISSTKERVEEQCLPIGTADSGLVVEDSKKTGADTAGKTRSNTVPCSSNIGSRSTRRAKRMTLDVPMPASAPENEDSKSEISTSKELSEAQCLSIPNTDTGSMDDLKTGMEAGKRKIVLGLLCCNDFHPQVNTYIQNEKEAETKEEPKVSVDQQKPLRRFTRSLLKSEKDPEDLSLMKNSKTVVDEADNAEHVNNESGDQEEDIDLDLPGTPEKIVDTDGCQKIVIDKIPVTVRELLETGLMEGYPVYYSGGKEGPVIHGMIRGNGILCACVLCKGAKVVAPARFGIHAINTYQRAAEKICFKNGKSLKKVVRICKRAKLNTLQMKIQEAIGPPPEKQMASCGNCKDSFSTTIAPDVELLCSSCMKKLPTPGNSSKKAGRFVLKSCYRVKLSEEEALERAYRRREEEHAKTRASSRRSTSSDARSHAPPLAPSVDWAEFDALRASIEAIKAEMQAERAARLATEQEMRREAAAFVHWQKAFVHWQKQASEFFAWQATQIYWLQQCEWARQSGYTPPPPPGNLKGFRSDQLPSPPAYQPDPSDYYAGPSSSAWDPAYASGLDWSPSDPSAPGPSGS